MKKSFDEIRRQGIRLILEFDCASFDQWGIEVEEGWPRWNRLERRSLRTILSLLHRLFGDLLEREEEIVLSPPEMMG